MLELAVGDVCGSAARGCGKAVPFPGVSTFSARKAGARVWPRVERILRNPGNTSEGKKEPAERAKGSLADIARLSPASRVPCFRDLPRVPRNTLHPGPRSLARFAGLAASKARSTGVSTFFGGLAGRSALGSNDFVGRQLLEADPERARGSRRLAPSALDPPACRQGEQNSDTRNQRNPGLKLAARVEVVIPGLFEVSAGRSLSFRGHLEHGSTRKKAGHGRTRKLRSLFFFRVLPCPVFFRVLPCSKNLMIRDHLVEPFLFLIAIQIRDAVLHPVRLRRAFQEVIEELLHAGRCSPSGWDGG